MFKDSPFFSGFSVDDIDAARTFYRDTLGLDVQDSREDGLLEVHAGSRVAFIIYGKPNHEPATYTVLNLPVPDVDAAVDRLIAAGVPMEHYDSEYLHTDVKGIARGNGPTIAWFRDPAGNIVSVLEVPPA
jgi:catechol 2,3-dioxygenase-like lactoylglutathione lyase family enzyme